MLGMLGRVGMLGGAVVLASLATALLILVDLAGQFRFVHLAIESLANLTLSRHINDILLILACVPGRRV